MKKANKIILLFILSSTVISLSKIYGQKTVKEDKAFGLVLNKIINDYPNEFNNLKGEKKDVYLVGTEWRSTENLPGYEEAWIERDSVFSNSTSWETVIINSSDSNEAIDKYREISEKIMSVKFDCCSLTETESSYTVLAKTNETEWTANSINPGKDDKFNGMSFQLSLRYPESSLGKYEVKLKIEAPFQNNIVPAQVFSTSEPPKTTDVKEEKKSEEKTETKALHIPDNNFADVIRNNCSECIDVNNNLLPAAKYLKKLEAHDNHYINTLEGIEGFISLEELDCSYNNNITALPDLPAALKELWIRGTSINNLRSLPPQLELLDCDECPLTSLPALPVSLRKLWCDKSGLTSLPVLPPSLKKISCNNCKLTSLPALPDSLTDLECNYSFLASLPKLPASLETLYIYGTKIKYLPPFPDRLGDFKISDNMVNCIPSNNPKLYVTDIDGHSIKTTFCKDGQKTEITNTEKKPEQDNGKCISGNCVNGIGVYVTKEGGITTSTYKGSFKDGKFDGKGTFTSTVGSYTGEFKNDLMEGMGTLIFKNGKKRTGVWKEGQLWSGTGYFEIKENESYYGGIKDNMPDGQGVYNYPNGKNFTGTFSKGNPVNGKGHIQLDKSSYEGTFVNGKLSGIGIRTFSQGILSGNFVDGELNGNGKWTSPDGDKYEGNFKNGNFDGYGVATSKNGRVYKGNWAGGKKNGTGSQYDANGNLEYNGVWNNGERGDQGNTVSKEKEMWDNVKKIFSRGVFKGHLNSEDINVKITDVYYINNDYKLTGTHLETFIYDGDGDGQDDEYSCKMDFTGTYDPVTHKIDIFFTNTIYKDQLPGSLTWKLFGITATIYDLANHPGYFVIKGDDSNEEFQETDYY